MNTIIETSQGRLRGTVTGAVQAYLGIPYAQPPVPPHRFMAPRPPEPWVGVRDAVRFAPQASPLLFPFLDPARLADPSLAASIDFHRGVETTPIPYGEDCLALNVWTPGPIGQRPVMVWLHGGGFAAGSGSWGWWTGDDLAANQDVVVVTLNHRLNIFGFLSLQDHGGAAHGLVSNAGMRDIIQALEWVRDNIAAFGGDPDNVTIFGQSGGGMKVSTLMAMPAAKGLFHKAIVQSGPFLRAVPRARAEAVAGRMLAQLDISPDQLERLQTIPTADLLAAFASTNEGGPGIPRQFAPVLDDETLQTDPFDPAAPPTASGIPLLIGATSEEATSLQGFRDPSIFTLDAQDLPQRVATFCAINTSTAETLIAAYRAARPAASPARLYAAIASDRQFGFGAIQQAERQTAQAPVFAYRLIWQTPVQGGRMGAPHNLDLPLIFGRDRAPGITGDGTAHHAMSATMQTAWARFARTGDPGWTRFDTTGRATMVFGSVSEVVSDPERLERISQSTLPPRI